MAPVTEYAWPFTNPKSPLASIWLGAACRINNNKLTTLWYEQTVNKHHSTMCIYYDEVKNANLHSSLEAYKAGPYPCFCSIKHKATRSSSTPPGWDANPAGISPPPPTLIYNFPVRIYSPGWREELHVREKVLPKNTMQWPWPRLKLRPLNPESGALTIRPPYYIKQAFEISRCHWKQEAWGSL